MRYCITPVRWCCSAWGGTSPFVGGTTLLVKSYRPSERYRAQAVNEAAVFGTSATGSLLAGTLLMSFGWMPLLLSTLPILLLMGCAAFQLRKAPLPTFA